VRFARRLLGLLLACGAGGAAIFYPLGPWLLVALAAYALVLWRYPRVGLPAILALLPLVDFAPRTGWVLLSEFDLLAATTLAVYLLRPSSPTSSGALSPVAKVAIGALAASMLTSGLIGLVPLSAFDANALFTSYTGFNSLRELKGFAWALALLPTLIAENGQPRDFERRWMAGMLAGLCGEVAVILWQRAAFAGMLDFAGDYRVEGSFPELHAGGGDVHAYLVMAIPFAVAWVVRSPTPWRIAFGSTLFVLASYALAVTFTRSAYVGYVAALAVMSAAVVRRASRDRRWNPRGAAAIVLLAGAGLAVLVTSLAGPFMTARIAATRGEATTREQHWARAIGMMDKDVVTTLFGMGLGSFPRTFLFKNPDTSSATFRYARERGNEFLRLGSGRPLYLDQRVTIESGQRYTLALDMRSADGHPRLVATLCEKSVQSSFRCAVANLQPQAGAAAGWDRYEARFDAGAIGSGPWLLRRPVALSLSNGGPASVIDVDNVQLLDRSGQNLIINGDFSDGGAHWYFSADDHLPWHIFDLGVQVLFEQGWAGVIALTTMLVLSLRQLARQAWRGEYFCAALLAGLAGSLMIGVTESLFDGPRVATLFFLLLFLGLPRRPGSGSPDAGPGRAETGERRSLPDGPSQR
jgi:hypothetical protein